MPLFRSLRSRTSLPGSRPSGRELLVVSGAAFVLTLAFFWRVALCNKLLLRRDMLRVVLPLKAYWAERVRAGHLPDWYPYDAFGQPFAGMMVSGSFHPGNLLFLVLPAGQALTWNALLCFPLLATGLWVLLRRLGASSTGCALGVVLGTFNGYTVCITNSLPYLQALALVPWTVFATMRFLERPGLARAALAALVLALVLFAGDTEGFCVVCALTFPVMLLVPSPLSRLARGGLWLALMLGTAAVAAPQLVAGIHTYGQSAASNRGLTEALGWSMHPLRLLELLLGPLFGTGTLSRNTGVTEALLHSFYGGLWVESVHFGAVGLVLALAGLATLRNRRLRALAAVGTVSGLLLALGKYGGLYGILYRLLWVWRAFRYPEKLLPYFFLLLSVLAALGIDRARESQTVGRWMRRGSLLLALALVLLAFGEVQALLFTRVCQWMAGGVLTLDTGEELQRNLLRGCALSAVGLLITAWAFRGPQSANRGWVVPILCLVTAFIQGEPLYGATSPGVLHDKPFPVSWLLAHAGPPHLGGARVSSVIQTRTLPTSGEVSYEDLSQASLFIGLEPMTPALSGFEGANAYLPAAATRVLTLKHSDAFSKPLFGLFGPSYVAANEFDFREGGGDPKLIVGENDAFHILLIANPNAKARVQLRRVVCVASLEEALRRTTDAGFDSDVEAIVECKDMKPAVSASSSQTLGSAQLVSYAPERVELEAEPTAPAVLFLADAYYSGWRATVDGSPTAILATNVAGRGVLLEPGKHRVVFTYRTPGLFPALLVSLGVLALGGALGVLETYGRARSRRRSKERALPG